jgi:DNA-binding transcriptional LysR family regulator
VELADVEAFLVLAEELHFARTGERMHVSPGRVSQRIQALEREVGGTLFVRTSRRVALTPLGKQLRDELVPAYAQLHAALGHARDAARSPGGLLRIGFTATTGGPGLDRLVTVYEQRRPGSRVALHELPLVDPVVPLRSGEIDVLVNWLVLDDLDLTLGPKIGEYPRVLAVAAGHPLAGRESVPAEVLADYPVTNWSATPIPASILRAIVPERTPSGRPVPVCPTPVRTIGEGASLIARGHAVHPTVATMAKAFSRDDITLIPIRDLPPLPLGLIWATAHDNARIRAFAAAAQQLTNG